MNKKYLLWGGAALLVYLLMSKASAKQQSTDNQTVPSTYNFGVNDASTW